MPKLMINTCSITTVKLFDTIFKISGVQRFNYRDEKLWQQWKNLGCAHR